MKKLEKLQDQKSSEQKSWRAALFGILVVGLVGAGLRSACREQDQVSSSTVATTTARRRPRVRITPMPQYFGSTVPHPIGVLFQNNGLSAGIPTEPSIAIEPADELTAEQRRQARANELCRIGSMVATDIQIAQARGGYSFSTVSSLTSEILAADYDVPGLPDAENPARAAVVRTCLEDELDILAMRELQTGSRVQARRILTAGGSIPSIFGACSLAPFVTHQMSRDEVRSCVQEMLSERVAALSGGELQRLFESVLEQDPELALTFFPGARAEVQTALRSALAALIARRSEQIATMLRAQSTDPTSASYLAYQLSIMRPLSDYQDVLAELSPGEY
ncbi:hypothetical protein KBB08_00215 [Candidatus Gracilibacteria bacterium]|nr:hypothetical protein [Candidatus Gracilibacteria bacterium]